MSTDPRTTILRMLVEDVPQNLERFDPQSGRFLTGDGWAVTNQDIIYPLALLYATRHPDNPYWNNGEILEYALRGGDAWRDFQYPDGKVEFVKVDGSRWGPIYMPWSMYHWLEAYALLRDRMDPTRRARWEAGLTLAYEGITAELAPGRVHNIPTWNAMAAYRAGQLFQRPTWLEAGRSMIQRTVAEQRPQGYWLEHHGPTTAYNGVYVHAIGLYHRFSGDDSVLPCLERALDFHIRYTYPDGRAIETIDGRVKYHDRVGDNALAAFSLFPRGRRLVDLLLEQMRALRASRSEPHITYIVTAGERKIAGAEYGLSPRLASAFVHYQEGPRAPIPQDEESYFVHDPGHAIVRRQGEWLHCLSGVVTPAVESRWGQDRQSFLSIWNARDGLVVGGGNAKEQPAFSTFVVGEGDGALYIPNAARLQTGQSGDGVAPTYGAYTCRLEVARDGGRVRITYAGPPDAPAQGQVPLKLHAGDRLHTGAGAAIPVGEDAIDLSGEEAGGWIAHRSWRLTLPPGCRLQWPVRPFNPYAADGAGPLEEAVAVLSLPLDGGPAVLELSQ